MANATDGSAPCTNRLGAEYYEDHGPCGDEGRMCESCEAVWAADMLAMYGPGPRLSEEQYRREMKDAGRGHLLGGGK